MLLDDGTIHIRDASSGAVLIAVQGGHTYKQQVEMPGALFSSDGSHIATARPGPLVHGDRDGARLSNIRHGGHCQFLRPGKTTENGRHGDTFSTVCLPFSLGGK